MRKFEWDPAKDSANVRKHGFGFKQTEAGLEGPVVSRVDARRDYGETRYITLAAITPDFIAVVVHTDRGGVTRIISARPASREERESYHAETQKAARH